MLLGQSKKGFIIVLMLLLFCSLALADNETPRRRFVGSVSINAGDYNDYYLRVITSEPVFYAEPGETISFDMYMRRGDDPKVLTNVQILDVEDEFPLLIEPDNTAQIRNIDMIRLKVTTTVPLDIEEGVYPVRIKVKGDDFVEEEYPLDAIIKVGPHTSFWNVLLLIFAAAFIGVIVWRVINIKKLGGKQ